MKYAALFGAYFIISILLLSHLNLSLSRVVAVASKEILNFFGNNFALDGVNLINNQLDVEINDLCAGTTELAMIFAAIMASYDVEIKKRLQGVIVGMSLVLVLNPIRISTTIIAFQKSEIIGAIMHDFLFRISLILTVIVYYMLWYNVSVKR